MELFSLAFRALLAFLAERMRRGTARMYGANWPVEETIPDKKDQDRETQEVPQWA